MKVEEVIKIRGAAEHNLKNISVNIPVGKITLITGDSGSGKSSLAFDVLYSEAKRRYLAALTGDSADMPRPRVRRLEPALAAVALEQHSFNRNPRSTVGTFTGLQESLRGIYELAGQIHCGHCGGRLEIRSPENVLRELIALEEGSMFIIKAPLRESAENGGFRRIFKEYFRNGFVRVEIAGRSYYLEELLHSDSIPNGKTFIIIDRIIKKKERADRISDSLRQALEFTGGTAQVEILRPHARKSPASAGRLLNFTEVPYCFACGRGYSPETKGTENMPDLKGQISEAGLTKKISGITIRDVVSLPVNILIRQLTDWKAAWNRDGRPELLATASVADDMLRKLAAFSDMHLDYLTLASPVPSLSSGEMLKVRLAAVLGRKLSGILYVLDEPLGVLREQERHVVRKKIRELCAAGNTVVVVEHDRILLERYADYVIELGPAAGEFGGQVIYEGDAHNYGGEKISIRPCISNNVRSGDEINASGKLLDATKSYDFFEFSISRDRNLKLDSLALPTGTMVGICGPSGSGKSCLARAVFEALKGLNIRGRYVRRNNAQTDLVIDGEVSFKKVWFMDEHMPRGSRSSNIATFTNIYRHMAQLLARTPSARARGITSAYLSLSRKGGRCERCKGRGILTIEPEFLPKISFKCDYCSGKRFSSDALSIKYRGLNISELLSMTVSQGATFFKNVSAVRRTLEALERTGLGYLSLGQPVSGLSGGERQRLKLASVVSRKADGRKGLFILDNPSRGLSRRDLDNLLNLLNDLVEGGYSILVVENNVVMLENCGWIIEMGPGGGPQGGKIVYEGPPRKNRPQIT